MELKIMRAVVCALLFLNILLAIVSIALKVVMYQNRGPHTQTEPILCEEKEGLPANEEKSNSKYCTGKSDFMEIYERTLSGIKPSPIKPPRSKRSITLHQLSLFKPMVHLQGLEDTDYTNDTSVRMIRNWNSEDQLKRSIIRNWMKYENGKITIPTHGMYRVYSQVVFDWQKRKDKHYDENQIWEHKVMMYNATKAGDEVLLSNNFTECDTDFYRKYDEYPSYLSGTFTLNAGDLVYVKTSHFDHIMADRERHFLGVNVVW